MQGFQGNSNLYVYRSPLARGIKEGDAEYLEAIRFIFSAFFLVGIWLFVMTELYNKSSERDKRRTLRKDMPRAEVLIWERLRDRQVEGCKFRRQYSIDVFVVDFYAPELKLALEIDGASHFQEGVPEYDRERQIFLEEKGTTVLRFTNDQIYRDLEVVVQTIAQVIVQMRNGT
jgi:very-short-patch-repair endonuclease